MIFASPRLALVRPVSPSFAAALSRTPATLDPERARIQHAGYVAALADAGVAIRWVESAPECPDAVFLEDTAVITAERAWCTTPGAPSRRAEVAGVRASLVAAGCAVGDQRRGGLDGGDVLRVGDVLYVGATARTDAMGAAELAEGLGLEVRVVPVKDGLHLKSAVTLAAPGLVVVDPTCVDAAAIRGVEVIVAPEPVGANVLALGDRVLVSADAPGTQDLLARRGLRVVPITLSELHRADGGLTCLSLRIPAAGTWCA